MSLEMLLDDPLWSQPTPTGLAEIPLLSEKPAGPGGLGGWAVRYSGGGVGVISHRDNFVARRRRFWDRLIQQDQEFW